MKKKKLKILYEDHDLIVVLKEAGILTISDGIHDNTLYRSVSDYVKKQNKNNKIFVVHRLDKDTSGLVIFAKNMVAKNKLQANWLDVERGYLAIVNGQIKKEKATLISYLKESKTHLVYSVKHGGEKAITEYETIKSNKLYSLLKINIKTGKKNQIRVQLNDLGYPLVGDKKYGKIKNKSVNRLCLHAYYLKFKQPLTNAEIILRSEYPKEFKQFFVVEEKDLI